MLICSRKSLADYHFPKELLLSILFEQLLADQGKIMNRFQQYTLLLPFPN